MAWGPECRARDRSDAGFFEECLGEGLIIWEVQGRQGPADLGKEIEGAVGAPALKARQCRKLRMQPIMAGLECLAHGGHKGGPAA